MNSGRFKIPLIYATIGILWIAFSDAVIFKLFDGLPEVFRIFSISKGVFFVCFTAIILYLLLDKQRSKILANEEEYTNIYKGNPNPIWFYNPENFKFVSVNDAAITKYGYSKAEFLAMTIMDIRPESDAQKVVSSYQQMSDQLHQSGVWKHLKKDGTLIYVNISSHKTRFEDKDVVMVMAQDVDQITRSAEQLKRTGEIMNKISNPVIISNEKGLITWINPAFTQVTGFTAEEIIGRNHLSMLHGSKTNKVVVNKLYDAISKNEALNVDLLNHDKFDRDYWVSLNLSPIFDMHGALECYISVQNDITERKEREAVIGIQNEKLKAVSWLNSHQIRKPVASILALTQLMKYSDNEEEKLEILDLLHRCAVELDEIILEINEEALV